MVSKSTKIGIAAGAGVAVIIVVVFASWAASNVQHNSYCNNFARNLDRQRADVENNPLADVDSFNRQVEEFNRECAY
jgi:hypothetical protein